MDVGGGFVFVSLLQSRFGKQHHVETTDIHSDKPKLEQTRLLDTLTSKHFGPKNSYAGDPCSSLLVPPWSQAHEAGGSGDPYTNVPTIALPGPDRLSVLKSQSGGSGSASELSPIPSRGARCPWESSLRPHTHVPQVLQYQIQDNRASRPHVMGRSDEGPCQGLRDASIAFTTPRYMVRKSVTQSAGSTYRVCSQADKQTTQDTMAPQSSLCHQGND